MMYNNINDIDKIFKPILQKLGILSNIVSIIEFIITWSKSSFISALLSWGAFLFIVTSFIQLFYFSLIYFSKRRETLNNIDKEKNRIACRKYFTTITIIYYIVMISAWMIPAYINKHSPSSINTLIPTFIIIYFAIPVIYSILAIYLKAISSEIARLYADSPSIHIAISVILFLIIVILVDRPSFWNSLLYCIFLGIFYFIPVWFAYKIIAGLLKK